MNLLPFIFVFAIPYNGVEANGFLFNSLTPIGGSIGEYDYNTKTLNLDYVFQLNIGNYELYFENEHAFQLVNNNFDYLSVRFENLIVVSPVSSVAIFQSDVTVFVCHQNTNLNYQLTTQISSQINNPVGSTFTLNIDNNFDSVILALDSNSYQTGYNQGYDIGYQRGHDNGYESGEISGNGVNNVIAWFKNVWNALSSFLGLEIAPNIRIYEIITIPIVIGVLMFVLKALIK